MSSQGTRVELSTVSFQFAVDDDNENLVIKVTHVNHENAADYLLNEYLEVTCEYPWLIDQAWWRIHNHMLKNNYFNGFPDKFLENYIATEYCNEGVSYLRVAPQEVLN